MKKAAALANRDLGVLESTIADAIAKACARLIPGEMRDQFVSPNDHVSSGSRPMTSTLSQSASH